MKETADDVVVPPLRVLALCAGGGGIELGLQLVLGREGVRTVGYCEREAYAAAVIVARMEDAALDHAPVWDDVGTFDGRRWRGAVDLVAAGFPCPPVSVAGKRKGDNDERWLWPDVFRVWQETGAPWLFVENVAGLRSSDIGDRSSVPVLGGIPDEWAGASERALQLILRDLAAGGYSAEWISLSAEQLGAPHQRDRVFLLAHADERGGHKDGAGGHPAIAGGTGVADAGRGDQSKRPRPAGRTPGQREPERGAAGGNGQDVADPAGGRRRRRADHQGQSPAGGNGAEEGGAEVADPQAEDRRPGGAGVAGPKGSRRGRPRRQRPDVGDAARGRVEGGGAGRKLLAPALAGSQVPDGAGDALPLWPPGRDEYDAWRDVLAVRPDLAPAVESTHGRVADGMANWMERLQLIGNGVVPVCAAVAFLVIAHRSGLSGIFKEQP